MSPDPRLRAWLDPAVDAARVRRQWAAIDRRLDAGRSVWMRGLAVAGATLVLGGAAFAGQRWLAHAPAPAPSASISSSTLTLADGSRVTLDPGAHLELQKNEPLDVATWLQTGGARFEVVPNKERVFRVVVDDVEVRVVGTEFRVEHEPATSDVGVSVVHGIVEVRSLPAPGDAPAKHADALPVGQTIRLGAGESWSTRTSRQIPVEPAPPSSEPAPPPTTAVPSAAPAPVDEAPALFEAANRARRSGDLKRASSLYRELVRRYPNDPRAKVAALEIARIEMDRAGDTPVAEGALRQAASADSGSSVQEDALARLVQLYAAKGDKRACQEARARYLAAYPGGVYAARVRAACASR